MIIAEQKRKENIAEYLLYMYQIEDLIRANGFDLQKIEQSIINKFDTSYDIKREMFEWYKGLIDRMNSEGIKKSGHMNMLKNLTSELNDLNIKILHEPMNTEFKDSYDRARSQIEALRMRGGFSNESDVQISLNGLYGLLILRLSGKEISEETQKAFSDISAWLGMLSTEYMSRSV